MTVKIKEQVYSLSNEKQGNFFKPNHEIIWKQISEMTDDHLIPKK